MDGRMKLSLRFEYYANKRLYSYYASSFKSSSRLSFTKLLGQLNNTFHNTQTYFLFFSGISTMCNLKWCLSCAGSLFTPCIQRPSVEESRFHFAFAKSKEVFYFYFYL